MFVAIDAIWVCVECETVEDTFAYFARAVRDFAFEVYAFKGAVHIANTLPA